VSRAQNRRTRAPIVTMTRGGASAAMLTLIAPTAHGVRVKASIAAVGGDRYRLHVTIGSQVLSFLVTSEGQIRQL